MESLCRESIGQRTPPSCLPYDMNASWTLVQYAAGRGPGSLSRCVAHLDDMSQNAAHERTGPDPRLASLPYPLEDGRHVPRGHRVEAGDRAGRASEEARGKT